jgi:acetolactate synthase-1/2/3 large subunit
VTRPIEGNEIVCGTLERLGTRHVFGVPGSQNAGLFDALRRSRIRTVLTTHELAASFMANGYARASGEVGVVATIPGPGFTYALTGLAEARLDSAAVLLLVGSPPTEPGRVFQLQAIDQEGIAAPLVKKFVRVERVEEVWSALSRAYEDALVGEPGPVVVQVSPEALSNRLDASAAGTAWENEIVRARVPKEVPDGSSPGERAADGDGVPGLSQLVRLVTEAHRPVVFAGLGAVAGAREVERLVTLLSAPLFTTPSGRGLLPEDHPLCLGFDFLKGGSDSLNELLDEADLVLALGCKFSHNGTGGFSLRFREDRLVQVNTDPEALGGNYAARLLVRGRVERIVGSVTRELKVRTPASTWRPEEVAEWRERIRMQRVARLPEPAIRGAHPETPATFFGILREVMPRDGILVTDSGLHQYLARRHFDVLSPGGLLMPSDFQSMGFGLPAAIGAKLACPDRTVVSLIGDGGLNMSGMEMLTAAREGIPLTVIVFNDGQLNLIRLQQYRDFGRTHAVEIRTPDMEDFAHAVGVRYLRVNQDAATALEKAIAERGPVLMEVLVGDSPGIRSLRVMGASRAMGRRVLGPWLTSRLKAVLGRGGDPREEA